MATIFKKRDSHLADELKSVSDVASDVATSVEDAGSALAAAATGPAQPVAQSKWYQWRKDGTALIAYLLDSEVHTFAFSVAANAILSFIPFVVLLYMLANSVFHSTTMIDVINEMVRYFFPSNQDFVARHLAALTSRHSVQAFSLVMIVVACTGIFLPLEVALNQAWGITKSRNYLMNQTVAFGLALLMVVLGMGSVAVNAAARFALTAAFFGHTDNFAFRSICFLLLAATTGIASILFLFSIYWLLPNRKVPPRPVLKTAVWTGIIWLASKYIFEAILPHLDLSALYGPFQVSVGLLFWAYVSGLILFAGAQFSVARRGEKSRES
jgi:YihY family inner membrane protein